MNYMKKYVIISGLALSDNNRGTAALGYGAFTFLQERGFLKEGQHVLKIVSLGNPLKPQYNKKNKSEVIRINGIDWVYDTITINFYLWKLFRLTGIALPFTRLKKIIKDIDFVAAINGGDGFSDIYNTKTFYHRLPESLFAIRADIPLIILPQTLGPFKLKKNYKLAQRILMSAKHVFVRDNKFISELSRMGVKYDLTNDLSYFMRPEPWDIDIDTPNSIGVNVSGLAYSNTFRSLSGQFEFYPDLIQRIIVHFQQKGRKVYLIPHSYCYRTPEKSNDDLEACRLAFNRLTDKHDIILIDKDLTSPQVKYLISKMSFFVGTRMHANFAAIYSKVPVFGLAYSYKFKGGFDSNGLDGNFQTESILNIQQEDIERIVMKIEKVYQYYNEHQ